MQASDTVLANSAEEGEPDPAELVEQSVALVRQPWPDPSS